LNIELRILKWRKKFDIHNFPFEIRNKFDGRKKVLDSPVKPGNDGVEILRFAQNDMETPPRSSPKRGGDFLGLPEGEGNFLNPLKRNRESCHSQWSPMGKLVVSCKGG